MVDGVNDIQTHEGPVVGRPVRPGDGERRAIVGFYGQYNVAANVILKSLHQEGLEWVRVADPLAGSVDDLQIGSQGSVCIWGFRGQSESEQTPLPNGTGWWPLIGPTPRWSGHTRSAAKVNPGHRSAARRPAGRAGPGHIGSRGAGPAASPQGLDSGLQAGGGINPSGQSWRHSANCWTAAAITWAARPAAARCCASMVSACSSSMRSRSRASASSWTAAAGGLPPLLGGARPRSSRVA